MVSMVASLSGSAALSRTWCLCVTEYAWKTTSKRCSRSSRLSTPQRSRNSLKSRSAWSRSRVQASTQAPRSTVMDRSPRQSSIFLTRVPSRSRRTRAAGFVVPVGGVGGGATSVVLAMVIRLALLVVQDAELHHPAGRLALLELLRVVLPPGRASCSAVDVTIGPRAEAMRALRLLGLHALLDPLLDLHDRGHQRFRRGRAAGHVHVHGDDLVDPLHDVVAAVEPAAAGADAHGDDPLGLGHLVVDGLQDAPLLVHDRAGHEYEVGLSWRESEDFRPEPGQVVVAGRQRHELDGAAS